MENHRHNERGEEPGIWREYKPDLERVRIGRGRRGTRGEGRGTKGDEQINID